LRLLAALAAAACAVAPLGAAAAAPSGPLWEAFTKAVDRVNDFTETVVAHEVKGDVVQDRVYRVFYRKPSLERTDIVEGPGRGGAALWNGGSTVRGHQGGILALIRLTLPIDDPKAVDLRGETMIIPIFSVVRDRFRGDGTVTEGPGPAIDGAPTDALTFMPASPEKPSGLTKEVLYLARATHIPVRHEGYEGATLAERQDFRDQVINKGIPDSTFSL
jgi:outer membrane lipoprotein-sorting protein